VERCEGNRAQRTVRHKDECAGFRGRQLCFEWVHKPGIEPSRLLSLELWIPFLKGEAKTPRHPFKLLRPNWHLHTFESGWQTHEQFQTVRQSNRADNHRGSRQLVDGSGSDLGGIHAFVAKIIA
jgi:hypothetical protein